MRYIIQEDIILVSPIYTDRMVQVVYTKDGFVRFHNWGWWTLATRLKKKDLIKIPHITEKRACDLFNDEGEFIIKTKVFRIIWFFWLKYDKEETFRITNPAFIQTVDDIDTI